ncbi:MAG: acetyl-CoA carboxylase biotin carboxyl carrier protein [Bacteroidota bacterium]
MDIDKVQALVRLVNDSGVAEIEVQEDGLKIIVRRQSPVVTLQQAGQAMGGFPVQPFPMQTGYPPIPPAYAPPPPAPPPAAPAAPAPASTPPPAPAAAPPATEPGSGADETLIRAPIVGTFYRAPSPEADPFVKVGARVSEGDTLCIIEAMKLMNEVTSEHSGTIKEILIENAQAVEYDQPLFVLTS